MTNQTKTDLGSTTVVRKIAMSFVKGGRSKDRVEKSIVDLWCIPDSGSEGAKTRGPDYPLPVTQYLRQPPLHRRDVWLLIKNFIDFRE